MGPSVGAGTIIFGNKNTGSGDLSGDITATPNVYQDGRMSTDTTATSATAKDGSSASAVTSQEKSSEWLSGMAQQATQAVAGIPAWALWVAVGGMAVVSALIIIFALVSGGRRPARKKGRR
ncbi:hypothetical protein OpiT1DRAFT_01233 [Opitutaceae bacterium TAV1]|nr:hypothetical protein OpiT1DRAFT_01233 [Opitutaceae bacterium TAV1]